jgi:hypothetical protein
MTKLIALRIVVAADDGVETKHAKELLAALVIEQGTQAYGAGRFHWGTAEVLQGPEKAPSRKNRAAARAPVNGQPELPT